VTADPNLLFVRAEQAYLAGDDVGALAALARVRQIAGEQAPVLHLAALAHKRRGDTVAAADAFRRARRLAPKDPQIANNHANLLDAMGDVDGALAAYEQALRAAPGFVDARLNRALVLQRVGRSVEALVDLDRGLAAAPHDARLLSARGGVLRDVGRLSEAADAFDAALRVDPARVPALIGRARVALERGEPDAAGRYAAAVASRPDDTALRLGHALAVEAEGGASAIPILEAAVSHQPGWIEGHEQLARMRSEAGEDADPLRSFGVALADRPDDIALHFAYWRALLRSARASEALDAIDAAGDRLGESSDLLLMEALAASESGRHARAERAFDRLGDDPDTVSARARHALRSGAPDRAATLLENVVRERRDDVAAWAHLSLAWRLTGDDRLQWLCGQPGLYGAIDLDVPRLSALAAVLRGLHRTRAHPIGQSLRGGTQTRGRLFARTESALADLLRMLEAAVAAHVAALPPRDDRHPLLRHRDAALQIAGSWSVRLTASGYHVNHIHPEGILSSAFYVSLPPDLGSGERRDGWLDLGAPPAELGLDLSPLTSIEPRPGRLALFPSYLFHGTRPFQDGERLTVAFDVAAAPV
jgi:tetratricopeptide (TPR) repeat protein